MDISTIFLIVVLLMPGGKVEVNAALSNSVESCVGVSKIIENDFRIQREAIAKLDEKPKRAELITTACINHTRHIDLM